MLRYLTAGESHGPALVTIVDGVPAGLPLLTEHVDRDLARRQRGYGRGLRMQIERDRVQILSGVRFGVTLGSPVALRIRNKDWENWQEAMDPAPRPQTHNRPETRPRPGHADLPGVLKYGHGDVRSVLERASARETAARVAAGAIARQILTEFGVTVLSHVISIGTTAANVPRCSPMELRALAESSNVACADPVAAQAMREEIDAAKEAGDTLGGIFEVIVTGVPPGLGSHVQWDRKLDGRLARALMSIQAIKGVEVGLGFAAARRPGSLVHDPITYEAGGTPWRFGHRSNHAGGIEGGMSNGGPLVLRAAMKPIATLYQPLESVDLVTKDIVSASVERSDVCAVPAAAVVGEAVVAFEVACAFLEKFGGDSLVEMQRNYNSYLDALGRI